MLILLVLSCLLFEVYVYGRNELRPNTGSWRDATENCKLASPNIIFSETGNTVDIGDIKLDEGQKAWVGYTMKYEIFQYIGCVRVADIHNQSIPHTLMPTAREPGQCSFACKNSTIFGLGTNTPESDCFCFETNIGDIKNTRKGCDKKCENDNFLCGNNKVVSLYTKGDITQDKTVGEMCLFYNKSGHSYNYAWATCSDQYYSLCFDANGDPIAISNDGRNQWRKATDDCFHENSYPMDSRSISLNLTEIGYWLAYINTLTISDIKGTIGSSTRIYGYVERRDNTTNLRFTTQSNVTSSSLCQTEFSSSTTSTTPTTTLSKTISQSMSTTRPEVAVYVGIIVASIVGVGVVVVVLFLYWKRRIQKLKERDPIIPPQHNITYTDIDNDGSYANISIEENAYTELELPNTPNTPNNFEDNSAGIYHIAQNTDDDFRTNQMGENTYFVLEKMNGLPTDPINKQPTDYTAEPIKGFVDRDINVYNKANNNMDFDDYDHIGNRARQQHQENGNYDTTFGQASNNALYDTTRGTNSGSQVPDANYANTELNI